MNQLYKELTNIFPWDIPSKSSPSSSFFPCVATTRGLHVSSFNLNPPENIFSIKEFFECFFKDLRDKLFHSRDTQHTLDLVLEANLPNLINLRIEKPSIIFTDTCLIPPPSISIILFLKFNIMEPSILIPTSNYSTFSRQV